MWIGRANRRNLILVVLFWSFASFSYYSVSFYMKYSPGNVFLNFGILGAGDFIAALTVTLIIKYFDTRKVSRILLGLSCVFSLVFTIYVQNLKDPKDLTDS